MAQKKKPMNPLLTAAMQATEASVKPKFRKQFDNVFLAGKALMYADQTEGMLKKQMQEGEPPKVAGQGAAKLVGLMLAKSKGTAPPEAFIPAGVMLTYEALDFLERAGRVQVDNEVIAAAVQEYGPAVLQILGVNAGKLDQMMARASDPQKPQEQQPQAEPAQPEQPAPPAQAAQQPAGALIGAM